MGHDDDLACHRLDGDEIIECGPVPNDVRDALIRGQSFLRGNVAAEHQCSGRTECQREEESAVNDYQETLKADLPLDVQYVVKRQYMDIKDAYDRIRILQRAA